MKIIYKTKAYPIEVKPYALVLALMWSGIVIASLVWNVYQTRQGTLDVARIQARSSFMKDVIYRRWNAGHGGVYVPVTDKTPPNPYLEIPQRDITIHSGTMLTLMNPAYMTRQVHELAAKAYGILGHITSLNPIRPANAPDPWETQALQTFHHGAEEYSDIKEIKGESYMRLMQPLVTEKGCLKCHAAQGYNIGDIRGGISVAVPMSPLWAVERSYMLTYSLGHVLLWLVGLVGLGVGTHRIDKQIAKREKAEEKIKASLKEKEILLQEIHHRVKNNMQVISSLLRLQASGIGDERVSDALMECQGRVQSMAFVHETLYGSDSLAVIDFKDYIFKVASQIFQTYRISMDRVKLAVHAKDIKLGIKQATPLGLIVTELTTNSLKYAFPENRSGEIVIRMREVEQDSIEFVFSDNGIGIPEGLDWRNTDSLGLQLVMILAEDQLDGTLSLDRRKGTHFTVRFRHEENQ